MAVQAKAVEPRFDSDFEIGAVAAMTMDAAVESSAIDVVMVADQAIHGRMFAMIEIQRQHLCSRQQRFTERDVGAAGDERAERQHRGDDGAYDERRMTAEDEAVHDGLVWGRADAAPAPEEHREAACGHGDEQDAAAVACGVPARRDYMHCEQCQQEAAEYDVRRLEVAVTAPEASAHIRQRGHDECQKHDEACNPRQLIQRRGEFQILDDRVVGYQRQEDMERSRAQGDPAQHFVAAEGE